MCTVKQTPERVNLEVPPDVDPEGERRVKRGTENSCGYKYADGSFIHTVYLCWNKKIDQNDAKLTTGFPLLNKFFVYLVYNSCSSRVIFQRSSDHSLSVEETVR